MSGSQPGRQAGRQTACHHLLVAARGQRAHHKPCVSPSAHTPAAPDQSLLLPLMMLVLPPPLPAPAGRPGQADGAVPRGTGAGPRRWGRPDGGRRRRAALRLHAALGHLRCTLLLLLLLLLLRGWWMRCGVIRCSAALSSEAIALLSQRTRLSCRRAFIHTFCLHSCRAALPQSHFAACAAQLDGSFSGPHSEPAAAATAAAAGSSSARWQGWSSRQRRRR